MPRYAITIEYIGTNFFGSQWQPQKRTIQDELIKAISTLTKINTKVILSGRTDKGVHAKGQVAHFDCNAEIKDEDLFLYQLNSILPDDISIKNIRKVELRFHAQKSAKWKWYQYKIVSRKVRSCFDERCFYTRQTLDIERINKMLSYLIGEHDFSAFKSSHTSNPAKVCRMYKAECVKSGDEYLFDFVADRFLYNMIRSIIGTVLMIEKDHLSPSKMNEILESKDRTKAGQTAEPNGLVLKKVSYTQEIKLEAQ